MAGPISGLNKGSGSTASQQNGRAVTTSGTYINGVLWPDFTTTAGDTAFGEYGYTSPNSGIAASAWQLPQNAGVLKLPTGITNQVPTSAKTRQSITQMMQMVDLVLKWTNNQKLSPAEIQDASELGGDIARAAQLQGSKQSSAAIGKATTEIAERLNNLGINPEALADPKTSKVPAPVANMLQNAGYAVTKNMTLEDMLNETTGPKAQQPLPDMSQQMTVGQYVQALGNLSKAQITQLQASMFNAGLYDPSYYDPTATTSKAYTQGVMDTATIMAFRNAMQVAFKTGQPLEQVIGGNLPMPAANATPTTPTPAGSLPGTSSTSDVPQTQSSQLQDPLIKAFQAALGRNPTQQELQQFTSSYNEAQVEASKWATDNGQSPQTNVDLQSGVPYLLTAPTATAAAAADAMNANPVEYNAHGIANAFGMLMNLVDRQGTSAFTTPGHAPDTTS